MSEHLGVADDTVMRRLHFYRLGGQAIFEVFEYEAGDQNAHAAAQQRRRRAPRGALRRGSRRRRRPPARARPDACSASRPPAAAPSEGQRWVYFLSPWGMQFELVSYPDGKAFDRQAGRAEQV